MSPTSLSYDGEKLRESEALLGLALAVSKAGIWQWDIQSDVVLWSPELLDVWGAKEFGGTLQAWKRRVHPDDVDRVLSTVQRALVGRHFYSCEFRIFCDDGSVRWVADLGKGYYDDSGSAAWMLGTTTDITDRRNAESVLRDAIFRAEASELHTRDLLEKLNEAQASAKIGSWVWSLADGSV